VREQHGNQHGTATCAARVTGANREKLNRSAPHCIRGGSKAEKPIKAITWMTRQASSTKPRREKRRV
jgi:hypothetical protein